MASPFFFLCHFFYLYLSSMPMSSHSITNPMNGGFAISLIHRDSPKSPLYNHSMTLYDRNLAAIKCSIARLNHIHQSISSQSGPPDLSPKLTPDTGEYIVSYYIGEPPKQVYSFIDTGSDVIWTKGLPYFDPSQSNTYTNLTCGTRSCNYLRHFKDCIISQDPCSYELKYGDGSISKGTLSRDKFKFDTPDGGLVDVGFLDFGYSFQTSQDFVGKQNGCLGLNGFPLSFISQLGIKRFSHCMVIPDVTGSRSSTMYFGTKPGVAGESTPMIKTPYMHYYVTLEGISIGDQIVQFPPGAFNLTADYKGGVMVDSGSSHTWMRKEVHEPFIETMRENLYFPIARSPMDWYDLCFKGTYDDLQSTPPVTFHFLGVDIKLMPDTTFEQVDDEVFCLAFLRTQQTKTLIGSFQMRDLWVEYDVENQVISFLPTEC